VFFDEGNDLRAPILKLGRIAVEEDSENVKFVVVEAMFDKFVAINEFL
jgi:hypothetical protein